MSQQAQPLDPEEGPEVKKSRRPDLVAYALVVLLAALVVIAVLTLLGPSIGNVYSDDLMSL